MYKCGFQVYSFRLGDNQGYTTFKWHGAKDSGLDQYFQKSPPGDFICSQIWEPLFKSNPLQQNNVIVLGYLAKVYDGLSFW